MTWIDYGILVMLVFAVSLGLWHGFVYKIISLIIWIAAFALAIVATPWLAEKITLLITDPQMRNGIAFAIVFMATLFAGTILNFLLSKSLSFVEMGIGNRFWGGVLGFACASLMFAVLLLLSQMLNFDHHPALSDSKFLPYFKNIADLLRAIIDAYAIPSNKLLGNK